MMRIKKKLEIKGKLRIKGLRMKPYVYTTFISMDVNGI